MKYQLVAVLGACAVAGLSGCSNDKCANPGSTTTPQAPSAKVVFDGKEQPQKSAGAITCTTSAGQVNINIGSGTTGVTAVLTDGDSPTVTSVGLSNIDGVLFGYQQGTPGGKASATKDGKKYTITGTATGVDMANPMQPVEKQFEIEVTCP